MRTHKYGAIRTEVDGIKFASRKESRRYMELKLLLKAKAIDDLKLQPRYSLDVKGMHVCSYVADFSYYDVLARKRVVEDSKGFITDVYRIKKKLMLAIYGIEIKEV